MAVARAVSLASGLVLLGIGYRAWATRDRPLARRFALLSGTVGLSALAVAAVAPAYGPYELVWLYTYLAVPVALALLSFDHYGVDLVTTRGHAVAFVLPAVAGAIGGTVVTLGGGGMMGAGTAATLAGLPPLVVEAAGLFHEAGLYYASGLVVVAVGLFVRTVVRYDHLDTGLGASLSLVGVWPWVGFVLMPEVAATSGYDIALGMVGGGYLLCVAAVGLVAGPYDLFDSVPAAGNVGPKTALDSIDDAVFVTGTDGTLLRTNAVARETFGVADGDAVGMRLAAVLGTALDTFHATDTVDLETVGGTRRFETQVSPVPGRDGPRGHTVVLRDVTRRQTREQRLTVLNRVLRHNLRNDLNVIRAHATRIAEAEDADPETGAEQIRTTADGLFSLGERARDVERMMSFSAAPAPRADVATVVERVVADVDAAYPDTEFTSAVPDDAVAGVDERVLTITLRNVVENAAEHNDAEAPLVVASATRREDGTVCVAVSDNGPGIPETERAVVEAGTEDPLEHGSGLGLWSVKWGVTRMGGTLSFAENDPRGTVVRVDLPPATEPDRATTGTTAPAD